MKYAGIRTDNLVDVVVSGVRIPGVVIRSSGQRLDVQTEGGEVYHFTRHGRCAEGGVELVKV